MFCSTSSDRSQLYHDPANKTLTALKALFSEMATLFQDDVMHIGADETSALGPCTVQSTFVLERALLQHIEVVANKTVAGWEELLFDAGAATNRSIVYAWNRDSPAQIIAQGRRAVDSSDGHWYFTDPAPGGPAGWSRCWSDARAGVPTADLDMLLGGEMSMWTDTYCESAQCGASSGAVPVGAALFPPERDDAFGRSVGGMIWPRGFVGAAAFWGYNSTADPSSPDFVSAIYALNDAVAARGGYVCPSNCSCDQLTACGVPYIAPPSPTVGWAAAASPCAAPVGPSQAWQLGSAPGAPLALRTNSSLCLIEPSGGGYPLKLAECDAASTTWAHDVATSELISRATQLCMDVRGDHVIGK